MVLGQILLLEGKFPAYAEIATKTVVPLLLPWIKPKEKKTNQFTLDPGVLLELIGPLCLVPLIDPDLLENVPRHRLRSLASSWQGFLGKAPEAESRQQIDQVVTSLYSRLGWSRAGTGEFRAVPPTDKAGLEAIHTYEQANRAVIQNLRKQIESIYHSTQTSLGRSF
jgi:hypothetical protein